ncbi:uncharacterized protein LOC134780126 [Penaeus indicus]|uniref:uncharacterized protein LOC134780126 n=1 Tax=Penaeus indicus TaxID=29960 RepID=UPI00300CAF91
MTTDMISVRQLQEKCREQGRPLYLAFIDLTKAFDLVSGKGLFRLLEKIGCPPQLRSMVVSFHEDMKSTVLYDGSCSEPFPITGGANTLFGIFFSMLLKYAFSSSEDGVYLHTRSDGKLFNLARLRAKTKGSASGRCCLRTMQHWPRTLRKHFRDSWTDSPMQAKKINRRIGKAVATMAKLSKGVWDNKMLTENTKMRVYQACILSTLL